MAQVVPWVGGNSDGYAYNTLTQAACPPLASTNIFLGGNADGDNYNTLIQSVCPPLPSTNIFLGGNADGDNYNTLTQSVCPPLPNTNINIGGNSDGYAYGTLTQSVCPPLPSTNISLGGIADGDNYNTLTQSVCPPLPSTNISLGGIADGDNYNTLTQSICPPKASTNISLGGNADGLAYGKYIPGPCPLPIQLLSFTADCKEKKVFLNWITATEQNNDFFTVEKSHDGNIFQDVVKVQGAGNSSTERNYSATDNEPFRGVSYYRIKQTDFNGEYKFYDPVAVQCSSLGITIYPTISSGIFYITGGDGGNLDIKIYNVLGEIIYQTQNNHSSVINLDAPNGVYFLNVNTRKESITQKIIIQK
jgi:hypothetical protein